MEESGFLSVPVYRITLDIYSYAALVSIVYRYKAGNLEAT